MNYIYSMGKKEIDRAKKKLVKMQKTVDDFMEKINRDMKDIIDVLDIDGKNEITQRRTRRNTPRKNSTAGSIRKDTLDDYDDHDNI